MEQKKTNPNQGLRALIDELYSKVSTLVTKVSGGLIGNASWTQSDWYVSWAHGNDTNPGTLALPVKTVNGGIVARWGTRAPILRQTTTIHVLDPQPVGVEKIVLSPAVAADSTGVPSNFLIEGTNAPVGGSFAAGVVTPKTIGGPGQLLEVTGFPAAAAPGMLVFNSKRDSYAVIDSVVVAGTVILTQPDTDASLTVPTAVPAPVEDNSWASGDTLQLLQPPTLNWIGFFPSGGDANAALTAPTCWTQFISIPDPSGTPGTSQFTAKSFGPGMAFNGVVFESYPVIDGLNTVFGVFVTCCWSPGGATFIDVFVFSGAFNTGLTFETVSLGSTFDGDVILHGLVEVQGVDYTSIGAVYGDGLLKPVHGAKAQMFTGAAPVANPGGVLWGSVQINVEGPDSAYAISPVGGSTFTNSIVTSGALTLEGVAFGTSYNAGVFTDGVAINVTTLDAHTGLQNPRTGSRFTQT